MVGLLFSNSFLRSAARGLRILPRNPPAQYSQKRSYAMCSRCKAPEPQAQMVLDYWFRSRKGEENNRFWFTRDEVTDTEIKEKFGDLHAEVAAGGKDSWIEQGSHSILALIIILDQFSRNIYRDSAAAFANDNKAVVLTEKLINDGLMEKLQLYEQVFALLPLMHSEDIAVHDRLAVPEFDRLTKTFGEDAEGFAKYEVLHRNVLMEYGRYPGRNLALGRTSTPQEIEYLQNPKF